VVANHQQLSAGLTSTATQCGRRTGIPQGSVLSVLLCGLFYAHLEHHVLRPCLGLAAAEQVRY
jgi:hypothetical protein